MNFNASVIAGTKELIMTAVFFHRARCSSASSLMIIATRKDIREPHGSQRSGAAEINHDLSRHAHMRACLSRLLFSNSAGTCLRYLPCMYVTTHDTRDILETIYWLRSTICTAKTGLRLPIALCIWFDVKSQWEIIKKHKKNRYCQIIKRQRFFRSNSRF